MFELIALIEMQWLHWCQFCSDSNRTSSNVIIQSKNGSNYNQKWLWQNRDRHICALYSDVRRAAELILTAEALRSKSAWPLLLQIILQDFLYTCNFARVSRTSKCRPCEMLFSGAITKSVLSLWNAQNGVCSRSTRYAGSRVGEKILVLILCTGLFSPSKRSQWEEEAHESLATKGRRAQPRWIRVWHDEFDNQEWYQDHESGRAEWNRWTA